MRPQATPAVEDYLKTIYALQRGQPQARVSTTALAGHLEVSPASATGMIQRLAKLRLAVYEPYRGVTLTERGWQSAADVIHRHEVIEQYLVGALGMSPLQAHRDAERWEHLVSPDLQRRMESLIRRR